MSLLLFLDRFIISMSLNSDSLSKIVLFCKRSIYAIWFMAWNRLSDLYDSC